MAQHATTYALLRELLPLHSLSKGELQAKLDDIGQHAFIAGVKCSWACAEHVVLQQPAHCCTPA